MNEIASSASALEQTAKNADPGASEQLRILNEQLQSMLGHLRCLDTPLSGTAPAATDGESDTDLSTELKQLNALLAEGDVAALDLWQKHAERFAQRLPLVTLKQVAQALDGFDFETALSLLCAWNMDETEN